MKLSAWDVIWPYDPDAVPPKPKLWVCVAPPELWFLRINSVGREGSVHLPLTHHPFLERDSWLHCWGELIEVDEARLEELLDRQRMPERRGIVGVIAAEMRGPIRKAISTSPVLAPRKIEMILAALG